MDKLLKNAGFAIMALVAVALVLLQMNRCSCYRNKKAAPLNQQEQLPSFVSADDYFQYIVNKAKSVKGQVGVPAVASALGNGTVDPIHLDALNWIYSKPNKLVTKSQLGISHDGARKDYLMQYSEGEEVHLEMLQEFDAQAMKASAVSKVRFSDEVLDTLEGKYDAETLDGYRMLPPLPASKDIAEEFAGDIEAREAQEAHALMQEGEALNEKFVNLYRISRDWELQLNSEEPVQPTADSSHEPDALKHAYTTDLVGAEGEAVQYSIHTERQDVFSEWKVADLDIGLLIKYAADRKAAAIAEAEKRAEAERLAAEQAAAQEEARKTAEAKQAAAEKQAREQAAEQAARRAEAEAALKAAEAEKAAAEQVVRDALEGVKATKAAQAATAQKAKKLRVFRDDSGIVTQVIYFGFDSDELTDRAKSKLDQVADLLKEAEANKAKLAGHTDSKGSSDYNLRLSQRRADNAKQYLIAKGVKPAQLTTAAKGETKLKLEDLKTMDETLDKESASRRTEIQMELIAQ